MNPEDPKIVAYIEGRVGGRTSAFGRKVANILDDIYGLHNLHRRKKPDYSRDWIVEVLMYGDLSTFDADHLTQLVVRCHDAHIRLSIKPVNMRYLGLMFHPREREGDITRRHPTIEQAVERVRSRNYYGLVKPLSEVA